MACGALLCDTTEVRRITEVTGDSPDAVGVCMTRDVMSCVLGSGVDSVTAEVTTGGGAADDGPGRLGEGVSRGGLDEGGCGDGGALETGGIDTGAEEGISVGGVLTVLLLMATTTIGHQRVEMQGARGKMEVMGNWVCGLVLGGDGEWPMADQGR